MPMLTISTKFKVYSQASWYALINVIPAQGNKADQVEKSHPIKRSISIKRLRSKDNTQKTASDYKSDKVSFTLRLLVP